MPHKTFRSYSIAGLEGTPHVIGRLVHGIMPAEYDLRPDPDRFTIREVLAHLADWEPIFCDRMVNTRDHNSFQIIWQDENQMAVDNAYEQSDPVETLTRFADARAHTVAFLRGLTDDEWNRTAIHPVAGMITIGEQVDLLLGHDGYHMHQIATWLEQ